ncbi:MAG: phosphoenolpyruvate-protein phosphotransferase [Coxiella sp. DG_40]|nr:MAG: phosphoenolpyruvate-protein phosphotransferase [Coxiella sp. DG_40]
MPATFRYIVQEISNAKDLNDALNILVQRLREITKADACSIFLLDKGRAEHVLKATSGLDKKLISKLKLKLGEGLIGVVGERAEPINVADTFAHPKFCHYSEMTKERYHAFLGVPIIKQGELLGVVAAQKHEPVSFDRTEEAAVVTLLAQLVNVITFTEDGGIVSNILNGTSNIPGVGIGKVVVVYPLADLESVIDKIPKDIDEEIARFKVAIKKAYREIAMLSRSLSNKVRQEERALFDAYLQILDSKSLKKEVNQQIRAGNWAAGALKHVIKTRVLQFEAMEDEYLRERSIDIKDLGQRILAHLQASERKPSVYPKRTILAGEQISPAVLADVPENRLTGIISSTGSSNSHMAILARAMGIPAVIGIPNFPITQLENKEVIIDGYYGQVYISPSKEIHKEFINLAAQEQELDAKLVKLRNLPTTTADGHSISLFVNIGLPVDIRFSLRVGAEGVGLYRTEIPFMSRDRFPTEKEQYLIYRQLLKIFAPRPVVMRTLDIGGDKNLPYFPIKEDNPFLGWRGIRMALDHPEIFLVQIRAMLRASWNLNNLHIMLPMVSSITEVESAVRLIKQAYAELIEEELDIKMPRIGVMIEVPSTVYQARDLARRVDFLSIGSNDLAQYLLAVDRNNAKVANLYDGLHPSLLKAYIQVANAARQEHKKIGICGEIAGDPVAAILLLAIGFNSLSMNASQLLRIKWLIRKFTIKHAKQLLEEVKSMDDPVDIRYYMESALEEAGCAGLIRAGK